MNTASLHNSIPCCDLPDVGSRLARGSVADLDRLTRGAGAMATQEPVSQLSPSKHEHSAKRKRGDALSESQLGLRKGLGSSRPNTDHSRDLMPPPPSPRRPYVFVGHVPMPKLIDSPFAPTARRPTTATLGPGSTTPRRQTSLAQNTGVALNGNELNHHSSVDVNGIMFQHRPNHRPSLLSVEASGRTPRHHPYYSSSLASMSSFEKRPSRDQDLNTACRVQLPAQPMALPTDPGDPSTQAITNSPLYPEGNLSGARRPFEALSYTPRTAHRLPANPSPGRLTLTPRYLNRQRHGLVANVRTSNDRLGTAASPHFGKQYNPYSSSIPAHKPQKREDGRHMATIDAGPIPAASSRYVNPFASGPTAFNGQRHPYSSTPQAKNFLLAQDPCFEEAAGCREQALSTKLTPAEHAGGTVTPANASQRGTFNNTAARGSSNLADPRDSAPASRSGRRPAHR